jgi:heme-degrading monooxygenase HmoA
MPRISVEDRHLTVLNLFTTDAPEHQTALLDAMRGIVDTAAFPGWISSNVHSGVKRFGTANLIQWRRGEDLEMRYAGEEFRHRTMPLFTDMTTSIRLLQLRPEFSRRRHGEDDAVEVSPDRDDYTVIGVYTVSPEEQDDLVDALGQGQAWLADVPGYRSHVVLRGLAARGLDEKFVVCYSQWDDEASHTAFHELPEADRPTDRQKSDLRLASLVQQHDWNSYRVVHTRSAAKQ